MYKLVSDNLVCDCFFCKNSKSHRETHTTYRRVSSLLLVAESLDPNDYIDVEACITCSHARVVK